MAKTELGHDISERQLVQLNTILLELGIDPEENIRTIVWKANLILGGSCSFFNFYNEKDHTLVTRAEFNAPKELLKNGPPEGSICFEEIIRNNNHSITIPDVEETNYYMTDSVFKKFHLKSYLGHAVILNGQTIGSLCIVDTRKREFTLTELNIIKTLAVALSLEVKRQVISDQLKEALTKATLANQAKTQFLSNMSHEIRTPLNGILGFSELLHSEETNPHKKRILGMIEESGRQLLGIINDMFDYSVIDSGRIRLHEENFNLKSLVEDTVAYYRKMALEKNLRLITDHQGSDPGELFGDQSKLNHILINLLGNAIKFTETGTVKVITRMNKVEGNKVSVEMIVEDTGIGIEKENLRGIFDDFRQVEHYLTKRIKGTGLGLTITKKIVEFLGGSIVAESEAGKGSRFTVKLEFKEKQDNQIHKAMDKSSVEPEVKESHVKLLLAEDNEANQFLIKAITKSENWDITVVDDGVKAIEAYRRQKFDLILMDVQMPAMNGYEATRVIRKIEEESGIHTPIIALTAYAMKSDKDLCFEAGMDDYIAKPFRRQQFLDTVTKNLGR